MSRREKKVYRFFVVIVMVLLVWMIIQIANAQIQGIKSFGSVIISKSNGVILTDKKLVLDAGAKILGEYYGYVHSEDAGKIVYTESGSLRFPSVIHPRGIIVVYWYFFQEEEAHNIYDMILP